MNPSGSILLSCAPHWCHPDTDSLAQSENEVVRRNAIPWRDHWMQGCFYVKSRLRIAEGSCAFVTAHHDEFSWWFSISIESNKGLLTERPLCECYFHMTNSRNRIMQINVNLRQEFYISQIRPESKSSILFTGDSNLLPLVASSIARDSKIFLLQDDPLCRRSIEGFNLLDRGIHLINNLKDIDTGPITHVIAEPHFNRSALPWDNVTLLWKQINELKARQKESFIVVPSSASIHAVPVHFLNLHKIRWPLRSTCEGFDHRIFDNVIEASSSLADENVEPFALWEYPCLALGSPKKIFDLRLNDDIIEGAEMTIGIENISKTCNGIAFWVVYDGKFSCGPSSVISPGELINWSLSERQGVHLIPSKEIAKGVLNGVRVKTSFDEEDERLAMDFAYLYQS